MALLLWCLRESRTVSGEFDLLPPMPANPQGVKQGPALNDAPDLEPGVARFTKVTDHHLGTARNDQADREV